MSTITTISDGVISASVDSAGAQLTSLMLGGTQYLWQRDPKWWPRCAPILFPIVGVLRDGYASSKAGDIRLSRHGIARSLEHEIVRKEPHLVSYTVTSNEVTKQSFPYDWQLDMTFEAKEGTLFQTFTVTNIGEIELPFTLGAHPAFNVPVPGTDESFEDYELRFEAPWNIETSGIDENGLEDFGHMKQLGSSDILPLSHELFEQCLTLTLQDVPDSRVTLIGKKSGHGVEVGFDGFPYLGVWSADNKAPFVAIEPWLGVATALDETDVFEEKRGIQFLEPEASLSRTFTMRPF